MSGNNSWQGGNSDEQPTQFQDFSQQGQQPSPGNNGGSMPQWGNQPQGQGSQGGQPYGQPNQGQYGQQPQGQFGSQPGGNSGSSSQQFGTPGQQYGGQPPYGQQQYGQQGQPGQGQYGSQPGQSQYGAPSNQYGTPSAGSQVSLQERMKKSDGSLNIAFVSGIALAVAALFILIGSIGTWASVEMSFMGQTQKASITGLGQVSDGGSSSSSDDVKDGIFTLIFAIGLIAMAALYLLGKLQKKVMWGAVVLAALTVALSLYDVFDIKNEAGDIPSGLDASVSIGWGLWLVLLFGLVALGASVYTALRDE